MRKLLETLPRLWDPDFTKLTPRESEKLKSEMTTETVPACEIYWDK